MSKEIDISNIVRSSLLYELVATVFILNILDMVTTVIGLHIGLGEANPFASLAVPFLAFKFGVFLSFLPLIHLFTKKRFAGCLFTVFLILTICVGIFAFVVIHNLAMVLGVFL